jgi:hypothetical protein
VTLTNGGNVENRTRIEAHQVTRVFFEGVLKRPDGSTLKETRATLEDLQSWINLFLRDGYTLESADKVERVQVKLLS